MGKWLQELQQRAAAGLRVLFHPAHAPGSYGNYTSLLTKALAVTYDRAWHPNPLSTRDFLSPPGQDFTTAELARGTLIRGNTPSLKPKPRKGKN